MWAGMALLHSWLYQKSGHRFACHGAAQVCMKDHLTGRYLLSEKGLLNESFCQFCILSIGYTPACNKAAVDIQDNIEAVIAPLYGSFEFGDVPSPYLIRAIGEKLKTC